MVIISDFCAVVQKLQSRTSFISDTPLSEEAAFTLASRSLLAEDPPPSMLLRVASLDSQPYFVAKTRFIAKWIDLLD